MRNKPSLPVPPPLRGAERGSFAEDTVKRRLPDIARRVIAENDLLPKAREVVDSLVAEMPYTLLRPLTDPHASDYKMWQSAIEPHRNQNWLQVPWFFAETYFFRRIIEAVDFFQTGLDPFVYQKERGLEIGQPTMLALAEQLAVAIGAGWHEESARRLLAADLWGNQVDMSLWAADAVDKPDHLHDAARQAHLLVDERTAVITHLSASDRATIDFIIDNAGVELVGDLALADYLLTCGKAATVQFHLKMHPTFVSDAVVADVFKTVDILSQNLAESLQAMGQRLADHLANGRLQLLTHPFWTSPFPLWHMPDDLRHDLASSSLVICKGDANYRRALGDAHWPFSTPLARIVSYFPAPVVFLRTCKSPVLAGVEAARLAELDAMEKNWVMNGRWGVIQFVIRNP